MKAFVLIDGRPVAPDTASVSVFDRGFLYGDSVFETLRTYDGKPFALKEHIARLFQSAARVLIDVPVSPEALEEEVRRAVASAGYAESYVRVTLTRGRGESLGLDPGLANSPLRVVIVTPLGTPPTAFYEQGISALLYRTERIADGTAATGAKIGNYLIAVLATHACRTQGAQEALLVDARGLVLEGATSNVFGVRSGKLVTPPLESGILPGITRAHVLEVAASLAIPVELRALPVEELFELDELFISSSIRELLAVVRVDGKAVGAGVPGPVYGRLLAAFRDAARARCHAQESA